uniref:Olfactory receptor n=1 Tax=Xenopus tropicalis TaxID=8364 RepID=A0A803JBQ5_XENTR
MGNEHNETLQEGFYLLGFSSYGNDSWILFTGLLLMYLLTVLGNLLIVILVCLVPQLHTPMYFFLCNLAAQDIISASAILPKLLAITVSGDTNISFQGCITQIFLLAFCGDSDFFLLASMAYDRYVAICIPLRYYLIMNLRICVLMVASSWVVYVGNGIGFSLLLSNLSFCKSHDLKYLFCDIKKILELACGNTTLIEKVITAQVVLMGILPLVLILTSYICIIYAILKIRSLAAFSSCSSHLTVVLLFCGTSIGIYMKPDSQDSQEQNKILSLLYIGLVPLLNPLVYSLRNRQVWSTWRPTQAP